MRDATSFRKAIGPTSTSRAKESRKAVAAFIGKVTKAKAFSVTRTVNEIITRQGVSALDFARDSNIRDVVSTLFPHRA